MTIEEKLDQTLQDFKDINLESETARAALIKRIIDVFICVPRNTSGEVIQPD